VLLVETSVFTRRVTVLLPDEDYREFQAELIADPKAGDRITGTGGLRKIRWSATGRGKRGGVRIIYYHLDARARIYLLVIYAKNEKDDLSPTELRTLRRLMEEP